MATKTKPKRNREGAILLEMKPELRQMLEAIAEDTATAAGTPSMADMLRLMILKDFKRRGLKLEGE